jgi:vancomycin resistance protein VanW
VFSVWKLAPEPTARRGYELAAVVRGGVLGSEAGGSICLLSTVLYNVALLAALEILERHCHSLDYYNGRPYFELGRDAAIEYAYLDLRFRNPHDVPLVLHVDVSEERVEAWLAGPRPRDFAVNLEISEPEQLAPLPGDHGRYRVHTTRVVAGPSGAPREDLGWSTHRVPGDAPRVESAPLP